MQIDRTTIVTGPAIITYAGQTFWSKGDILFKPNNSLFDIPTSRFGKVDRRWSNKQFDVTFEPDGRFTAALAALLWPYASTDIGSSIYGATDRALVIHGRDGIKITLHNAALTEMPNLRLGVAQTLQGSCKFTALLKNATDPSTADAYFTIASEAFPGDAGWAASAIKTLAYDSAWGAAPWDGFLTEAGWEIAFGLQLRPQSVDGLGVIDMTLQGLDVTARAIPVGPSMADLMSAMSPDAALGSSLQAISNDLIISADGIHVSVYNAAITETDLGHGTERKRLGQTTWTATRTVTAGAVDPLFRIGTAAPA